MSIEIKEGDVFYFSYSEEFLAQRNPGFGLSYLSHCFDGQLVAQKAGDQMKLVDTYWNDNSSKCFTVEEAEEKGELTFRFNVNDVEPAYASVTQYYDEGNWFDFSHQHGCYKRFVLKKGAKKSNAQMLKTVDEQLSDARRDLEIAARRIERLSAERQKIELGDINVYL